MADTDSKNTPSVSATLNHLQEVTSIGRERHSIFGPESGKIRITAAIQIDEKRDFKLPPLKPKDKANGTRREMSSVAEREDVENLSQGQGNASSRALRRHSSRAVSASGELRKRSSSKSARSIKRGPTRKSTSRSSKSRNVYSPLMVGESDEVFGQWMGNFVYDTMDNLCAIRRRY
eukprot:TRINITY_DN9660_c0_g4_i1.p1 TRINITY_DN9660_c0_g4~~TRINITY_DN9660_c0_g4_i1.p1  ORF type:complete len:176 (+),score=16.53 TRINITY_DN9660_c0_g4_i1:160-687(+)